MQLFVKNSVQSLLL